MLLWDSQSHSPFPTQTLSRDHHMGAASLWVRRLQLWLLGVKCCGGRAETWG